MIMMVIFCFYNSWKNLNILCTKSRKMVPFSQLEARSEEFSNGPAQFDGWGLCDDTLLTKGAWRTTIYTVRIKWDSTRHPCQEWAWSLEHRFVGGFFDGAAMKEVFLCPKNIFFQCKAFMRWWNCTSSRDVAKGSL